MDSLFVCRKVHNACLAHWYVLKNLHHCEWKYQEDENHIFAARLTCILPQCYDTIHQSVQNSLTFFRTLLIDHKMEIS